MQITAVMLILHLECLTFVIRVISTIVDIFLNYLASCPYSPPSVVNG